MTQKIITNKTSHKNITRNTYKRINVYIQKNVILYNKQNTQSINEC